VADRGLTGILLVGGASRRFGSPKAIAKLDNRTLAERAWSNLAELCDERIAVGKAADRLELAFPVLDDQIEIRAPIAGLIAGLRAASHELAVVLPIDTPLVTPPLLLALARACRDAAVPHTGPLPGAFRRTCLPVLERRLAASKLDLRGALGELDTRIVAVDEAFLVNLNTPADLEALTRAAGTGRGA
jgi:molybdenum cofactor guanylyltransferase